MAPAKTRKDKSSKPRKEVKTRIIDDDQEMKDVQTAEREASPPPPKGATEEQLEKLLFGDEAGFHDALREYAGEGAREEGEKMVARKTKKEGESEGESDEESVDFENMQDEDLFFLDSGPIGKRTTTDSDDDALMTSAPDHQADHHHLLAPPAWEDSDDDRITVSLAGTERLRKLRATESEDVVTGKEYVRRLRKQFERLNPAPAWVADATRRAAKRRRTGDEGAGSDESGDEGAESEDEQIRSLAPLARLLQNAGNLTRKEDKTVGGGANKKRKLRPEVLDIARTKDVPGNQPSSIDSMVFHPHYPLLLSSGPASTLFLHHISPDSPSPNPLLTSLHIRKTPLYTSAFSSPQGDKILFSGRRRYFHVWDLDSGRVTKVNGTADRKSEQKTMERFKMSPCGRWMGLVGSTRKGGGIITVLDAVTMQWVAQVRVDSMGGVADFAWWRDGEGMCVVGKNGEVSEWDGRLRRVVSRWTDEGAVGTTVIALGGRSGAQQLGGDRWVAIGSSSGIVNIYDRKPWQLAAAVEGDGADDAQNGVPRAPKPARVLDQLTTPTSHLVFSNDGQLLVMASRWKKDALRLVHLPSCTVYRNWPTSSTPFGRISAVAISPTSDMIAVANEAGKIRLWNVQG